MISGVGAISERCTAYTSSQDLGPRYTGPLRDIYAIEHRYIKGPGTIPIAEREIRNEDHRAAFGNVAPS